jgi:hypothetical protein
VIQEDEKMKKALSVLLTMGLTVSMLAGCGSNGAADNASAGNAADNSAADNTVAATESSAAAATTTTTTAPTTTEPKEETVKNKKAPIAIACGAVGAVAFVLVMTAVIKKNKHD